jgi:hypothetical protein
LKKTAPIPKASPPKLVAELNPGNVELFAKRLVLALEPLAEKQASGVQIWKLKSWVEDQIISAGERSGEEDSDGSSSGSYRPRVTGYVCRGGLESDPASPLSKAFVQPSPE